MNAIQSCNKLHELCTMYSDLQSFLRGSLKGRCYNDLYRLETHLGGNFCSETQKLSQTALNHYRCDVGAVSFPVSQVLINNIHAIHVQYNCNDMVHKDTLISLHSKLWAQTLRIRVFELGMNDVFTKNVMGDSDRSSILKRLAYFLEYRYYPVVKNRLKGMSSLKSPGQSFMEWVRDDLSSWDCVHPQ
ncbi:hypothetical protein OAV88_02015 [bacterium]|nr:hypothetical protein [bacterium]